MLSVTLILSATLPPAAAVAQEADQEREGVAAPEPTAPSPETVADPDFDPGGETALPFDVGAPDGGGDDDSGDGAPVDVEPVTDPDALAVPLDDPAAMAPDALDGADEPVAPVEPAPPTPLPAPAPAPAPPPTSPPPATTPQTNGDNQAAGDRRQAARDKRSTARKRQRDRVRQRPAIRVTIPAPPAVAPPPATPAPVATTTPEPAQAATTKPRARAGEDTYTVQPDDHLWKIASDLLGPGATNGEIVAESNRLYGLNRDVIGGDPNVLIAGTVLRLR